MAAVAPVLFPSDPVRRREGTITVAVAGSVAIHVGVMLLATLAKGASSPRIESYEQTVQVQMMESPEPQAARASEPAATPAPPRPPPVAPRAIKTPKAELPPPEPVDLQVPLPPPPSERPRRVVSMESSTLGGGAAIATGGAPTAGAEEVDRPGPAMTAPRRTSAPTPEYPATLRAQGIEGEVGLEVEIDPDGRVIRVTVAVPSEHDEFNRSAKDAAARSTYEPARVNGVAVARAITFTVRFRLHP